jgi:hypothetical protein
MMEVFWAFKSESILPLYAPSQKRRYNGQTKPSDSLRLLPVEVVYRGKVFENEEEEVTKRGSVCKAKF